MRTPKSHQKRSNSPEPILPKNVTGGRRSWKGLFLTHSVSVVGVGGGGRRHQTKERRQGQHTGEPLSFGPTLPCDQTCHKENGTKHMAIDIVQEHLLILQKTTDFHTDSRLALENQAFGGDRKSFQRRRSLEKNTTLYMTEKDPGLQNYGLYMKVGF